VVALDIADPLEQVGRALGERGVGLLDERRALDRLLAVREQPHARARDPEHGVREGRAHEGELDQVLRAHLDVRADVDERHGVARDRDGQRERRAVDAAAAPDLEQPGRERRPRRARGDERLRVAGGDRARGLHDRRLGGRSRRPRGVGLFGDRHRRVDHRHVPGDLADLRGRPEEQHGHAGIGGAERDLAGAEIGPVGVDGDRRGHGPRTSGRGRGRTPGPPG
jgi:hypothetical protein